MANEANIRPHQWKPGQSGNPKGRPKKKTVEESIRDILGEEINGPDGEPIKKLDVLCRVVIDKAIRDRDIATIGLLFKRLWPEVNKHELSGTVNVDQQMREAARELDRILDIGRDEKENETVEDSRTLQ